MDISVLITSYNQALYLREAVDSAIAQTVPPLEILICDDGSMDESRAVIEAYQAGHPNLIRGVFNTNNLGIAQNRNNALREARGDWVLFLDGDDRLLPRKLEASMIAIGSEPTAQMAYADYFYIDASGNREGRWTGKSRSRPPSGNVFKEVFAKQFPHNSLFRNELLHRASLLRSGEFDPDMKIYEDWEFRLRFSRHNKVIYTPEPLSEYRLHDGGISNLPYAEHVKYIRLLLEKNANLLDQLDPAERRSVVQGFLSVESKFSLRQCLHELRRCDFSGFRDCASQRKQFRDYANSLAH